MWVQLRDALTPDIRVQGRTRKQQDKNFQSLAGPVLSDVLLEPSLRCCGRISSHTLTFQPIDSVLQVIIATVWLNETIFLGWVGVDEGIPAGSPRQKQNSSLLWRDARHYAAMLRSVLHSEEASRRRSFYSHAILPSKLESAMAKACTAHMGYL